MLSVLQLMGKFGLFPFWLLWRGYLVLWWAFDDGRPRGAAAPAPKATPKPIPPLGEANPIEATLGASASPNPARGQDAAFQVVDSRSQPVPRTLPTGALKGGFVGTIIASIGAMLIMQGAVSANSLNPAAVFPLWLWTTATVSVASIFAVRHVVRKREQRKARMLERIRGLGESVSKLAGGAPKAAAIATGCACVRGGKCAAGHAARIAGPHCRKLWAAAPGWAAKGKAIWSDLENPVKPVKSPTAPAA